MKLMKTALIAMAAIVTLVATIKLVGDHKRHTEWEQSRGVATVYVAPNDTLWDIAEEYKPSWMDTREYICEIKTLNGKSSSMVYEGERLTVYVNTVATTITTNTVGHYTLYGHYYNDGVIVTEDGNAWVYDTQLNENTDVLVVFSNNGTLDNICDDIIINIWEA